MKIAIAQMISHADLERNLSKMESFAQKAKEAGARLILFPEMAYFSGKKSEWTAVSSQYDALLNRFCQMANQLSIALIPGTLREPSGDPEKFFNTLPFIDEMGTVRSHYRKLFLYKASLPDRNYDETEYSAQGNEIVTQDWHGIRLGFSICFDLRFPELFRALKKRGAQIVFLPAAFTVPTGQAHWEVLIRARAIENQFFLLAPGITGISGDGSAKYGHSLAVNPWGVVKANLGETESLATLDIEPSEITEAESKVPAWKCRREELLTIS